MYMTIQFYTVNTKVFLLLAVHFRNNLFYLMSAGNSEPYQTSDQRDPDDRKSIIDASGKAYSDNVSL